MTIVAVVFLGVAEHVARICQCMVDGTLVLCGVPCTFLRQVPGETVLLLFLERASAICSLPNASPLIGVFVPPVRAGSRVMWVFDRRLRFGVRIHLRDSTSQRQIVSDVGTTPSAGVRERWIKNDLHFCG
jgi:hypothetical protein